MLVDFGSRLHRYPTTSTRLGRHHLVDSRSLRWLHHHDGSELKPAEHMPKVPVLDQEDLLEQNIHVAELVPGATDVDALGSCTGNAGTAAVSALLTADQCAAAGLNVTSSWAAEEWAIELYSQATKDDDNPGQWPPTDAGSSGLGVARALKDRGLITGYVHATNATGFASLLQSGTVMAGIPWFQAWFDTQPGQLLDEVAGWETSGLAGGHEICVVALETVEQDWLGRVVPEKTVVKFQNSWTAQWCDGGFGRFSLALYAQLRSHIDLIQLKGA